MERLFNFANGASLPRSRPAPTRPTGSRTTSSGSLHSEDPLVGQAGRLALPSLRQSPHSTPRAPQRLESDIRGNSRIAVVLTASPRQHRPLTVLADDYEDDESGAAEQPDGQVLSDLSPQFQRRMASVKSTATQSAASVKSTAVHAAAGGLSRGRPKGWKPGMSYASMRGNTHREGPRTTTTGEKLGRPPKPKVPSTGLVKRRGRPPKQPSPPPETIYQRLNPPFVAFLCEWRGCKAELHNLDTLRRHAFIVHGKSPGGKCLWAKCASKSPAETFTSTAELKAHINKVHIIPFGWHIGDGPQNSTHRSIRKPRKSVNGTEAEGLGARRGGGAQHDIPDFLKDEEGNQVTPSIRDQEVEDLATWKSNRRKLKQLLIKMNDGLPSEEETGTGDEEME